MLNYQVLDLTDQMLYSGGSVDNGESIDNCGRIDNGNQGSANNRRRVDDNWCRIRNWCLNSSPLNFRGSWSLNRCRWSLDLSGSLNWDWNWSLIERRHHDFQHPPNSETDNGCPRGIQMDVSSWFENVRSDSSFSVQQ
jgi:hypothetical protein